MEANLKLGRAFGIQIGLHWSWFIIFVLVTLSLSFGYFDQYLPNSNQTTLGLLGIITSLLFFITVLAHEFGHAVVALRRKLEVQSITLFVFGGVAQIGQEPRSPEEEFWVAIAGPLVTILAAMLFQGISIAFPPSSGVALASAWLARINFALFIFNLIPGFPLDGGRIFRSILWKLTKNYAKATRVTSYVSQVIAFAFIALGIYSGFRGSIINGIWLVFIGWFLQSTASATSSETGLRQTLANYKVADVMQRNLNPVQASLSLDQVPLPPVDLEQNRFFPVLNNGRFCGLISMGNILACPLREREHTRVSQVMIPAERLIEAQPEMSLLEALTLMDHGHLSQIPVIQDGEILGVLSHDRIMSYLKLRSELGVQSE